LLYWYKSTDTDAAGGAAHELAGRDFQIILECPAQENFLSKLAFFSFFPSHFVSERTRGT
jgi:hypothetical protein